MYINCLWVSGKFKGQGYADALLEQCISDGREAGKKGLVVLSSKKKKGFLSDPKYLTYKGFEVCDTAEPYFELRVLPFEAAAEKPCFREQVKHPIPDAKGIYAVLFGSVSFHGKICADSYKNCKRKKCSL